MSYKWIMSPQAAWLFGLASAVVCCCWPILFRIDPSKHEKDSVLLQVAWGSFGVVSALSCFFIMLGMRQYRRLREFRSASDVKSTLVSVFLFVGVWWAAVVYYLLVYLPARRGMFENGKFW
jgi:hypothetical protein